MALREVPERFDVAFSLAGEQRQIVLPVVQELESILGTSTVFYDEWFEHWIAGSDADLTLQQIYSARTDLVVVCVSGNYGSKPWTRAEHKAIRARMMEATDSEEGRLGVLPLRVGDGEVNGVLFNDIVPDLRKKTAVEAADLIVGRLNLIRPAVAGTSHPNLAWPSVAPALQWPMADHREARLAFAELLTSSSPSRALLIRGPSETGKSHISKQMIRNAMNVPGVLSGRFDFKGTTNMSLELEAFSRPLDIDPPEGHILNERLSGVFTELRRRARPTVLVFDTYEAAGEATEWLEKVVLPQLLSAEWLRVVIIGQVVPVRAGATWESIAAKTVTLQPPGPEDWCAYGRENRGDEVDLEFVTQVYKLADGKASVLAGLLGPRS